MSSVVRLGLFGFGQMGAAIASVAADRADVNVTKAVHPRAKAAVPHLGFPFANSLDEIFADPDIDVVVDFTNQALFHEALTLACRFGKPFVSGTTALTDADKALFAEAAAKIPFLHTNNTSVSMALFRHNVFETARLVVGRGYDVHIHEVHHNKKKDAPSGTAKMLAEDVLAATNGAIKPEISAERGGTVPGYHQVTFYGNDEVIRLSHNVQSRRVFAAGAVDAALWLAHRPSGLYTMDDVLGISRK